MRSRRLIEKFKCLPYPAHNKIYAVRKFEKQENDFVLCYGWIEIESFRISSEKSLSSLISSKTKLIHAVKKKHRQCLWYDVIRSVLFLSLHERVKTTLDYIS